MKYIAGMALSGSVGLGCILTVGLGLHEHETELILLAIGFGASALAFCGAAILDMLAGPTPLRPPHRVRETVHR